MANSPKLFNTALNVCIVVVIGINAFFLLYKKDTIFRDLNIEKPTLLLVLSDAECADCIRGLSFLNSMQLFFRDQDIDVQVLVYSPNLHDPKGIVNKFIYPTTLTDDDTIFKVLNSRYTPLLIGVSAQREIFFLDTIPKEIPIDEAYISDLVVDRLHYARNLSM